MNAKEYVDKKVKGLAEVVKAGGGYAFAVKRYSHEDGKILSPEIESVDLDDLVSKKAELEAEVADYTTLIADVNVLKSAGKQ